MDRFFQGKNEKAFRNLLREGVGGYAVTYEAGDPGAEDQFLIWMEARRQMARKPKGVEHVFLSLASVPEELIRKAKDTGVIEGEMHEEKIDFDWSEYPDLVITFREMFRRARQEPDTRQIFVHLINIGDITERLIRNRLQKE